MSQVGDLLTSRAVTEAHAVRQGCEGTAAQSSLASLQQRFWRLQDPLLQDSYPGFGEAARQSAAETSTRSVRTGLASAPLRVAYHAGAGRRLGPWETGVSTMEEADKIIFGSSTSDRLRSTNRQQSPMLSPGRVRWACTGDGSQAVLHPGCQGCCLQVAVWLASSGSLPQCDAQVPSGHPPTPQR